MAVKPALIPGPDKAKRTIPGTKEPIVPGNGNRDAMLLRRARRRSHPRFLVQVSPAFRPARWLFACVSRADLPHSIMDDRLRAGNARSAAEIPIADEDPMLRMYADLLSAAELRWNRAAGHAAPWNGLSAAKRSECRNAELAFRLMDTACDVLAAQCETARNLAGMRLARILDVIGQSGMGAETVFRVAMPVTNAYWLQCERLLAAADASRGIRACPMAA